MSHGRGSGNFWQFLVLWLVHTIFRDDRIDGICPEKLVPTAQAMHAPSPCVWQPFDKSWPHNFSGQLRWWNLSWKQVPTALHSHYIAPSRWSSPPKGYLSVPTVSCLSTMSTLPSQRSSPQAISHIFLSVHNVKASISLPPMVQRSSLKAISYDLLSVHNVRASVSLPPNGALPNLFPTVSCPSTKSTLPSRSLPTPLTDLSPGYFPIFSCPRFRLAASQRSFLQAISHYWVKVVTYGAVIFLCRERCDVGKSMIPWYTCHSCLWHWFSNALQGHTCFWDIFFLR